MCIRDSGKTVEETFGTPYDDDDSEIPAGTARQEELLSDYRQITVADVYKRQE